MANDSPAVIIFDINGNPIGSILDGSIYRLQTEDKIASWFGSSAPTVGQKTMSQSIPVVLPIDQTVSITASIGIVNQGNPGTIGNSWFMELTDGTNVLGTSAHPIKIDPVGTTIQPVSGTITSNQGSGGTSPWMMQGATADGYTIVGNTFPISAIDDIGTVRALNAITDGGKILAVQDETANDLLREILDKLKVMSFYLSQMADIDLE